MTFVGRELQPDQGHDHQVVPDHLRPGLRVLGLQRDRHGHGRPSAPRRRHRPGLLRVDEQRERPLEQRELPRQRHVGTRTTPTRHRTTRNRSTPSSATTRKEKNYSNYTNYRQFALSRGRRLATPSRVTAVIGKCNVSISALGVPGDGQRLLVQQPRVRRPRRAFTAGLRFLARQQQPGRG